MYIKTTTQLFAALAMLSAIFAQNDGLVVTKYDNGGIKVEGNYTSGVRNGAWAEYWEEVWWFDYGEDGEPNTKDTLENNNRWDSVEVVIPDFKPKLKLQGNYLNGNRDGTWTEYFEDGKRKTELNYLNGKFNGLQSYWSSNGNKIQEKNYIDGKQQGLWTLYYQETGIKKEETNYIDGVQEGLWTEWYEDGQKRRERNFKNGERDSTWTTWYKNGNKKFLAGYSNGKLNGKYIRWYEGGIIKELDGDYLNNKKHKKWIYWSKNGQKTEEINYDKGIHHGSHIKWFGEKSDQHKNFHVNYKDGDKDGKWHYWYSSGVDSLKATYLNGEKDGHWIWWRKNGLKDKEGFYKKEKKHGLWTIWNDSTGSSYHKLHEETYVNDAIDGKVTKWYKEGGLDRQGIMRGKEKEGEWTYWERGGKRWLKFDYGDGLEKVTLGEIEERDGITFKIGKYEPYVGIVEETGGKRGYKLLGRFLDGKRDGKWVQWYDNGQVEVQGEYYRGKKHGEWSLWYNNGKAKEQGTFSFGKVDSLYKYWFDNGHLKEEQRYKKGLAHGRWTKWYKEDPTLKYVENGNWQYKDGVYKDENNELWSWWWYLNDNKEEEGYYIDGNKEGAWVSWFETGVKSSEGAFSKNERDGLWLYYNEDGAVTQELTYSNDLLNGRETKWVVSSSDSLGKEYEKFWKDGQLNGPATTWVDGFRSKMVTYKGESETGREIANGPWVIWYPDSDQIMEQGFHKNNIRDGLTTYYYENGNKKKEGNLSANVNQKLSKPEGVWTYWNKDGQVDFTFDYGKGLDHVKFKDLSKIDESELLYKIDDNTTPFTGVIVDENKEEEYEFLGRLKNGKKDGPWIRWYESKKVPEVVLMPTPEPQPKGTWSGGKETLGAYKDGKKHGLWTTYYSNQQIKDIGTYENGVYNGKWTFYYENGEKEKEGTLRDGNAHDKWIFYNEKGKRTQEGSFNEGLKNGKWIAYFEDGKLTEGEYKDGKKDGTWTSWWDYDRTRKEMQGSYKSGKMVDKWYFYNNKGNLKEIRYFSPVF